MTMRIAAISFAAVAIVAFGAEAANAGADLVSHRAIYRMSLATAKSGSGVTAASGAMSYKFGDSCNGWTVENKTALSFAYSDGAPVSTTWDFVTWESKDGLHYRFRVRSTRDGVVNEEIEGVADLDGKGKGGVAKFTLPEAKTLKLPKGTLFPTEHTVRMIELAQAGEHLAERTLFDGTGTDQAFQVSAIIGKLSPALTKASTTPEVQGINRKLLNTASWPMQMAFFPDGSADLEPDYEVGVRYYENGVADEVLQSFGNFSLKGTLEKLEAIPKTDC
jgi:hypothetical protein